MNLTISSFLRALSLSLSLSCQDDRVQGSSALWVAGRHAGGGYPDSAYPHTFARLEAEIGPFCPHAVGHVSGNAPCSRRGGGQAISGYIRARRSIDRVRALWEVCVGVVLELGSHLGACCGRTRV